MLEKGKIVMTKNDIVIKDFVGYYNNKKENAIEMEVKRLDTMVTALQQQLDAVEEAEGKAIERATPKFNGVG